MIHDLQEFFRNANRLTYVSLGVAVVTGILLIWITRDVRRNLDDTLDDKRGRWTSFKFFVLIVICILSYFLAYTLLRRWFPSVFQ